MDMAMIVKFSKQIDNSSGIIPWNFESLGPKNCERLV